MTSWVYDQFDYLDSKFLGTSKGACIVVGGGPSVTPEALDSLSGTPLVPVNMAILEAFCLDHRDSFVAGMVLDDSLLRKSLREFVRSVDCPLFTGNTPGDTPDLVATLRAIGIHRIPSNNTEGLGDSFASFSNGGNSGFAGIQLAALLGFKKVGLLGFDGRSKGGPEHFHDAYPVREGLSGARYGEWRAEIDRLLPWFDSMGVSLVDLGTSPAFSEVPWVAQNEFEAFEPSALKREVRDLPASGQSWQPSYGKGNSCYGGAVNAASPGRYVPVPQAIRRAEGDHLTSVNPIPTAVVATEEMEHQEPLVVDASEMNGLAEKLSLALPDSASSLFRLTGSSSPDSLLRCASRVGQIEEYRWDGEEMILRMTTPGRSVCRVFIGSEPRSHVATEVLIHSIRQHCSLPVDITVMDASLGAPWDEWNMGRHPGTGPLALRRGIRGAWATDFSRYRWAVPELCNFAGRAIYLDSDCLVRADLADLWSLSCPRAFGVVPHGDPSVMLMDCSRVQGIAGWPSLHELRANNLQMEDVCQRIGASGEWFHIPEEWNSLDSVSVAGKRAHVIHFTELRTQPWRPYPDQLQYTSHPDMTAEQEWFSYSLSRLDDDMALRATVR